MTVIWRREAITIAIALLAAMAAGSLLILAFGQSPAAVYALLIESTWTSAHGIGQVIFKATPLVFTGLSVALAFRAGLFNIGAEGQLIVGAFATAAAAGALPVDTPAVVALPVGLVAGVAAGALWGAIPGILKATTGAHEVINTIMLNFIASGVVLWLGNEWFFLRETEHTGRIADGAALPGFGMEGSAANASAIVALLCAVAVWWFIARTRRGFELRAVGANPAAAEAGGVDLGRAVILAMTAAGGLAGLVGSNFVLGYKHYYENGMGTGTGFMGIAVALLGRNHPVGIVLAALLFSTLSHGALAASELVPRELIDVLQAVIILAVASGSSEVRRFLAQVGAALRGEEPARG
ncbi:MAG TPA: ABC transporter permease [Kofleriaceae bacterium]|nr:ABC transporter permease [Kofleriaceae bacterium]